MRTALLLSATLSLILPFSLGLAQTSDTETWQPVTSIDGSAAQARHESGAVAVDGKLYLLGGRGMRTVQRFDPTLETWSDLGPLPLELHHFQPVAIDELIYVIAGFTCCFPLESLVPEIHVFDTQSLTWSVAGSMPASRARGSAATVVRDGLIYVLGGNTQGHSGGAVAWFDRYDPATGEWTELPDAPHARDHFAAVLNNDYLVAASGRQTSLPNPFANPVLATDVYDFVTEEWRTADAIPTARAGALAGAAGDEVIVAGGEIDSSATALATVEAFNVYSGKWRSLQPLALGRHSGGGVVLNGQLHVLAGSLNAGGAPETTSHEALTLNEVMSLDFDSDGLRNLDERIVHGTNPASADTDFDELRDDVEINEQLTDPLASDTDEDGIADGMEVNAFGTSPISADSDDDGLNDSEELFTYNTNPLLADTDADELSDQLEISVHMTDPADTDSDNDGVSDGEEVQAGLNPLQADSDDDGIDDGQEIENGSDPLIADSDSDGDPDEGNGNVNGNDNDENIVDNNGNTQTELDPDDAIDREVDAGQGTDMNGGETDLVDTDPVTPGDSSSGNVSILLIGAFLVGRLSRSRKLCVKVTSNFLNS